MAAETLLSFPPDDVATLSPKKYDDLMTKYLKSLDKLAKTWTVSIGKKNILDLLSPEVNSIPYLLALNDQIKTAGKSIDETHLTLAASFLTTFDPVQVRYVGEDFRELVCFVLECAPQAGADYLVAVTTGLLRLDPTAGTFTSMHLLLVRACLQASMPSLALPILDKDIYAYPAESQKNVPEDLLSEDLELSNSFITAKSAFSHKLKSDFILEYYLHGAQVYIGLRNYDRARLFLEYILLTPTIQHATSMLQVEAYQKWAMVGLLAQGKTFPLPRTLDSSVTKSIRAVGKPYDALAESFERRNWRKYQAEMEVGTQQWHGDGNFRLVQEAASALLRYRVIDLQKTYAALPVGRVATHLEFTSDETLTLLSEMIRSGLLNASITPAQNNTTADAVLRFHFTAPTTVSSTAGGNLELELQTQRIESLVSSIRDADRRLQLSKEYVEYQKRQKRSGPDAADLADQMDLSYDNPIEMGGDEDIMAG
ncbi:hypothetical protein LTR62_001240 [Meristemomyces frigidus]|uniref:COP9 signalosome complex subunit 3 N-terminal helical repeats domain-containing protein n=1 Tax=Meristemomyces frigidus TaxID=1508187 RepID=A0AAN7TNX8_9PEZI|nr:hypothetical protein LTR62_001240 [Meristemomyces frigidus]